MQSFFKRHEKKYLITKDQAVTFQSILSQYMEPDRYGEYLVQNLYYDTANWDIIRSSIEKPLYKEKLRLRCYAIPDQDSNVFLDLKKKYKGIVYKRRLAIPYNELPYRSVQEIVTTDTSQIARELDFYFKIHAVSEKVHISYHRAAFTGGMDKELRVTMDTDIRFRMDDLCFSNPDEGQVILPEDMILMEIKTPDGIPLWMARALSGHEIFPTTFSKYGVCYTNYFLHRQRRVYEA